MMEFIQCVGLIIILLLIFYGLGYLVSVVTGEKHMGLEQMILGFFFYFLCLDIITVPLIMLKQPFSLVVILWALVLVTFLTVIGWCRVKYKVKLLQISVKPGKEFWKKAAIYGGIALIVLVVLYLVANQNYWGWDTAYYMGIVSTTLDSNSMFLIDGENGRMEKYIGFRYALSSFYMSSAFWCKVTGISVVFFQKYVMGSICIVLYFVLVCLIGKQLFKNNVLQMFLFFCVVAGLNMYFITGYTTSDFLLTRSYEAKAFCANVVFPAMFLYFLKLHDKLEQKDYWTALRIIVWGSVPVSMSSILIAPAMVVVFVLTEWIGKKEKKMKAFLCKQGVICVAVNVIFLILYFLFTKGILRIRV